MIFGVRILQGFIVGNPITNDLVFDEGSKVEFSHGMGLISDEQYQVTQINFLLFFPVFSTLSPAFDCRGFQFLTCPRSLVILKEEPLFSGFPSVIM